MISCYSQDLTPEQARAAQAIVLSIDNALGEKIEFNNLITRMTAFASVYHFAFGSKEDREVAIAQWAKALSGYPEWVIKQVLDSTISTYKASDEPLTPALIIAEINKVLRNYYNKKREYVHLIEQCNVYTHEEYIAYKKAESERLMEEAKQKRREEDERKASIARAANQFEDLRKENEEAAAKKIAEWEAQLQAERKQQAESIKNTMQKFKDNARLVELYEEFEELRKKLGGE